MSNCQDNRPTFLPEAVWKALMNLPALRYMKAPVDTVAQLYEKYPIGNEKGTFAFVHDKNTFYTYHPRGWHRGEWKPISADGISSFFEIDTEFLKEGDILVYDNSKQKFVVKSGNVWNKLLGDLKDTFSQVTKFLNQVDEVPTNESGSGVYFVHKDEEVEGKAVEFRALYIVLGKKAIKIYQSTDYYTATVVQAKIEEKADQTQVDDIASSVDILATQKADKSVVDALMNGIIKQPSVETYSTGANSLSSIYGLTANNNGSNGKAKENGWDVLVKADETKGGISNRYNWNGSIWVDMDTGLYDENLATLDDLRPLEAKVDIIDSKPTTVLNEDSYFVDNSAISGNQVTSNTNYKRTGYVDCSSWDHLILSKGRYALCSFFTSNSLSTYISDVYSSEEVRDYEILVPKGAKYVIINNRKDIDVEFSVVASINSIPATDVLTSEGITVEEKISIISEDDSILIIDEDSEFIDNSAVSSGEITENVNYKRTGFYNCLNWGSLIISKGQYSICSFFKDNNLESYLSTVHSPELVRDYEILVPKGAKYVIINDRKTIDLEFTVRVNYSSIGSDNVATSIGISSEKAMSRNYSRYRDKYFSVMGDSISNYPYAHAPGMKEVGMWYSRLIRALGAKKDIVNAISGTTIANHRADSFLARYGGLDFSNTEILIIEGGMNDLGFQNTPLGIFDYTTPLSGQLETEFIPAYRKLIEGLRNAYPKMEIILCTVSIRTISQSAFPWTNATTGNTWVEYNNAIRQLASDYGCVLLDLAKAISWHNASIYTTDGVHPNEKGIPLIANYAISGCK